jgi:hypothetical protein
MLSASRRAAAPSGCCPLLPRRPRTLLPTGFRPTVKGRFTTVELEHGGSDRGAPHFLVAACTHRELGLDYEAACELLGGLPVALAQSLGCVTYTIVCDRVESVDLDTLKEFECELAESGGQEVVFSCRKISVLDTREQSFTGTDTGAESWVRSIHFNERLDFVQVSGAAIPFHLVCAAPDGSRAYACTHSVHCSMESSVQSCVRVAGAGGPQQRKPDHSSSPPSTGPVSTHLGGLSSALALYGLLAADGTAEDSDGQPDGISAALRGSRWLLRVLMLGAGGCSVPAHIATALTLPGARTTAVAQVMPTGDSDRR